MAAVRLRWLEVEQAVEFALQIARVRLDRGIASVGRRRPMAQAFCRNALKPGANTLSPASMAYCASRMRWARQYWCASA